MSVDVDGVSIASARGAVNVEKREVASRCKAIEGVG